MKQRDQAAFYPMTFCPVLKQYVWGGRNLALVLGRTLPEGIVAESWEIAAHKDGDTLADNGRFAGCSLSDIHAELGLDLIGTNNAWAQERDKFPLLVKLLDANRPLSVQVHPDDEYALAHEGNELGKSEMWVVLHAEPDAAVILGVKPGTTPARFRDALKQGSVDAFVHRIPVHKGDIIHVPSGSVHAILGGVIIAEIQQNSNTTYRVYDWGRASADRPLHIEKAMDVINFNQVDAHPSRPRLIEEAAWGRRLALCRNRYFIAERIELKAGEVYFGHCDGSTLEIWGAIEGSGEVNGVSLKAVRFTLLPAALGAYTVSVAEDAVFLRTYVPAPNSQPRFDVSE
ncbi:MAG: type I phosphomannose isomerase catalytic subunit [Anaerolineae bacterium]